MKDLKSIAIIVIVGALIAFIAFKTMNKNDEFKSIKDYVINNQEELEKIKDDYLSGNKDISNTDVKTIKVYKTKEDTLVYFTLKDKNSNVGFYYSTIDKPNAYQDKDIDLLGLGNDEYKWVDEENNNEGITNKITNNWYYYKNNK